MSAFDQQIMCIISPFTTVQKSLLYWNRALHHKNQLINFLSLVFQWLGLHVWDNHLKIYFLN